MTVFYPEAHRALLFKDKELKSRVKKKKMNLLRVRNEKAKKITYE